MNVLCIIEFCLYLQLKLGFPKYPTSSTEDLIKLFETEKEILRFLPSLKHGEKSTKTGQLFERYFKDIDYDW